MSNSIKKILILTLLLTGCGSAYNSDPIFDTYIAMWEEDTNRTVRSPIRFRYRTDKQFRKSTIGGVCTNAERTRNYIVINKTVFFKMPPGMKLLLLYHELVHCELDIMGHEDEEEFPNGEMTTVNIMTESQYIKKEIKIEDIRRQAVLRWRRE